MLPIGDIHFEHIRSIHAKIRFKDNNFFFFFDKSKVEMRNLNPNVSIKNTKRYHLSYKSLDKIRDNEIYIMEFCYNLAIRLYAFVVGNIHEIPTFVRCKNRKKKFIKENNHPKQYLRSSIIYLYLLNCSDFTIHREKYKMRQ